MWVHTSDKHLQVVAPSGCSSNNYQLLKTSRVTATGTTIDTSTNTATAIDIAIDFETATAIATYGFMRNP
jgi:hypothetical protein